MVLKNKTLNSEISKYNYEKSHIDLPNISSLSQQRDII